MHTDIRNLGIGDSGISSRWRALYFGTVGAFAGFLGSLAILAADVACARILGEAPFMLLRFYATLPDGGAALTSGNWNFFPGALAMHLVLGSAFGAVFMLFLGGRAGFQSMGRFLAAGVAFGLAIWLMNFYLILSWLQPAVNGRAYILSSIPWWVGAVTHAVFGVTVALVAYFFRNDVDAKKR